MGYSSWAGPGFGGVNMDFTSGVLNVSPQSRLMNFNETNGVICDTNGIFLFSSNGIWIANAHNDTMLNGSNLNPGSWTSTRDSFGLTLPQGNLIIPDPGNNSRYFLFHLTIDDYGGTYAALHLYYSAIDMALDSGLGAVTQKNVILLNDTIVPGALTACKHGNGRDWWVLLHENNSNKYYKYLLTTTGIFGPDTQSIGSVRDARFGQCAFSPDGNYFAHYEPTLNDLDIFSFDRCTGTFSNPIHIVINDSAFAGGLAFSPNSQILYVSSQNYVYQFNLNASSIPASKTIVAIWDSSFSPSPPFATTFYLSQLAPDGKIYINTPNSTLVMHVINYPDSLGMACDVQQHGITLPAKNAFTIANHPNYFLSALTGSACDTISSIHDLEAQTYNILIYPNPVSDNSFNISYSPEYNSKGKLEIFNALGVRIISLDLSTWPIMHRIDASNLLPGIYFLTISTSKKNSTKFIRK
jgi:hypothetical protein